MNKEAVMPERWALGLLACTAAITFFFPLISVHVPIAGDQEVSAYDAIAKIRQFREQLTSKTGESRGGEEAPTQPPTPVNGASVYRPPIPASVELGWMIPVFIMAAFVCALATLVGSLFSLRLSKAASTLGALCGVAATVHVRVMNSDVHRFLEQSMKASAEDLKGNPFAGLAETLGNLLVNAFQLKPGVGLYVLTASLALAAFVAHSRLLSRLRFIEPPA